MSSGPSLRGATVGAWTSSRIWATMSGFARVVMSPVSMLLEMAARTRRMILPERVLGMSGTMWMVLGRAILPIMVSLVETTLSWMGLVVGTPGLRGVETTGRRPLTSSPAVTTAASATSVTVMHGAFHYL